MKKEQRGHFRKTELDVRRLAAGFYVLDVQIGETSVRQKFIKN